MELFDRAKYQRRVKMNPSNITKITLAFVWITSLSGCITNIDIIKKDESRESRVEVQVITETSAAILPTQEELPTNTASPEPPTTTPSPIPPTFTPEPTSTPTLPPSPTPLPGLVMLPVETLGESIPWLPLDTSRRPVVNFIGFNNLLPPFNNPLVRQAFAHAVDRDAILAMAKRYWTTDPKAATTLTPSETLGRDLYNAVGAGFDPQKANELLAEAGYSDPSAFPVVTIIVNAYGDVAPGARFNMANAMAEMWMTNLGVTVKVDVIGDFYAYNDRIKSNPPEMFWQGWVADNNMNDPDGFLRAIFRSDSPANHGGFSSAEFDRLVDTAAQSHDPVYRQELYIQAERILCETETALIPLFHSTRNIP